MNAISTITNGIVSDDERGGTELVPTTPSPTSGRECCPIAATRTVAAHDMIVNATTQGFRRWVASEIAPKNGIEITTMMDAIPLTVANSVFHRLKSSTIHATKNRVIMFIENTVLAKS